MTKTEPKTSAGGAGNRNWNKYASAPTEEPEDKDDVITPEEVLIWEKYIKENK